jgi:carbamoyl-phosphate synthase large subunit
MSEYLPGLEYSIDCVCAKGKLITALPRKRLKMIGGISVHGEFEQNLQIIEYCEKIVSLLQLDGNIGIQVKGNYDNEFLILEINPRVQGTISSCLGGGVNLPDLAIKAIRGEKIKDEELVFNWNVKFYKYWEEVFYE